MNETEFQNWLAGRFRSAPSPEPPERLLRNVEADRALTGATPARRVISRAGRIFGGRSPLAAVFGLTATLVLAVALVVIGISRAPAGPSSSAQITSYGVSPSPAASSTSGMVITDAQAIQRPGTSNPVIVTATITNRTGQVDKLVGASSPVATTGGLYATCGCSLPASSSVASGMEGLQLMPWWLINPGETIQLRAGDGSIVLSGVAQPLTVGQTTEVTFEFASSTPVMVEVPVVASGN